MANFIKEMERKGYAIWAVIKHNNVPMVCLVNEDCNYALYHVSKKTEKYLKRKGYKFIEKDSYFEAVKKVCKLT